MTTTHDPVSLETAVPDDDPGPRLAEVRDLVDLADFARSWFEHSLRRVGIEGGLVHEGLDVAFFYIRETADLAMMFFRTLHYCVRGKRERGAFVEQCHAIGNQSLLFCCVTMSAIGAIVCYQMCLQTRRVVPDVSLVGATFVKVFVRDLGASIGAVPLATRVGAAIAAQIGSMVVTEQTDALRMCGADPVDYLVVPRFLASILMGTVVIAIGFAVAWTTGMIVAHEQFGISPYQFANFRLLTWGDCALGLIKAVVFCGTIPIVGAHRGLRSFGGSEGVGKATTQAVVGSMFLVIVFDLGLSIVGHFVLPP